MLQMIAKLAESVADLPPRILHRIAHDRAINFVRRERRNLPIDDQQESREREIYRHRPLRILLGPQPFLEALLRGRARTSESGAAIERALAQRFEQPRRVEHLRAHPAFLLEKILVDKRDPLGSKIHRDELAFLS